MTEKKIVELKTSTINHYIGYSRTLKNLKDDKRHTTKTIKNSLKSILSENGKILLVVIKNDVVAMLSFYSYPGITFNDKRIGKIDNVVTRQGFETHGFGTMLLRKAISILLSENCFKIELTAKRRNGRFYRKRGFINTENNYIFYPEPNNTKKLHSENRIGFKKFIRYCKRCYNLMETTYPKGRICNKCNKKQNIYK